jgi:hypothetical protein
VLDSLLPESLLPESLDSLPLDSLPLDSLPLDASLLEPSLLEPSLLEPSLLESPVVGSTPPDSLPLESPEVGSPVPDDDAVSPVSPWPPPLLPSAPLGSLVSPAVVLGFALVRPELPSESAAALVLTSVPSIPKHAEHATQPTTAITLRNTISSVSRGPAATDAQEVMASAREPAPSVPEGRP